MKNQNELAHYGVKGMKWGKRQTGVRNIKRTDTYGSGIILYPGKKTYITKGRLQSSFFDLTSDDVQKKAGEKILAAKHPASSISEAVVEKGKRMLDRLIYNSKKR